MPMSKFLVFTKHRGSMKYSKLNLRSGKQNAPPSDSQHFERSDNKSALFNAANKENLTSILVRAKLSHMSGDSRSGNIGHSLSNIKSRPSNGIVNGHIEHGQSQLEASI